MQLDGNEALQNALGNPARVWPGRAEARGAGPLLKPDLTPRFTISPPCRIFTMGSCFARNIEEALADAGGFDLPAMKFSAPKSEWPYRPNGLLNEYNPGTMHQRILRAIRAEQAPQGTLVEDAGGWLDLLLHREAAPVAFDRALARRAEIDAVYDQLAASDVLVMTLGLAECWFDMDTGAWLNRFPPVKLVKKHPSRYVWRRLELDECVGLVEEALGQLLDKSPSLRILLTVSPVPFETTFTTQDAIVANSYSKSVLRVCADMVARRLPQVDYFPSYEIVMSGGLDAFNRDNAHVKDNVVRTIVSDMIGAYLKPA